MSLSTGITIIAVLVAPVAWPWWLAQMMGLNLDEYLKSDNWVYVGIAISLVIDAVIIWTIAKAVERLKKKRSKTPLE